MDLLKDSPRRTTSVQWPAEVDDHLDLLVALVAAEGVPVSRAQLLSALVADAHLNGEALSQIVRRYLGGLQVGDLAAAAPPSDDLPASPRRGRRRSAA
ncbi:MULTISPECIES: hypothetical protein [unclassified Micromonospora]|uniref:hypothetical protein n=1 Tax=unclassified Micromonospora TaxID=2617518 RepID=UPI001C2261BC|nr:MULTISPECIES: hypothetical protein [unclassified Micromonospora]MBU8857642.1 hypothetical protein [Micromonospora sp. WMMB482]MDM4783270.1 hypothetical protein [Micromonospora sp. b486]